jgi:hypothetical protein
MEVSLEYLPSIRVRYQLVVIVVGKRMKPKKKDNEPLIAIKRDIELNATQLKFEMMRQTENLK